jgi:centromeric protein E
VKQNVHTALSGINQTVFAYGQTSSGKTFTMRGSFDTKNNKGEKGLIPLSIQEIFRVIKSEGSVK